MSQTHNYNEKHTETAAREKATQTMKDLQQGNLPENKDLLEGVDLLEQKLKEVNPQLSHTGQKASKDVRNILENTREIIGKNEDEHLQKAFKHAQTAGKGMSYQERIGQLRSMLGGVNAKELTTEARGNIKSFFTIIKLAFLSPEFRSTTNDFFTLFGDMIARQSEKGEERLRNKQEGPEQEGYPEPKHGYEWIEREGTYSLKRSSKQERARSGLSREQEDKLVDRMVDLLQTFHKYPEYSNSITYISQTMKKLSQKFTEGKQKMDSAARQDTKHQQASNVEHHQQRSKDEMRMFLENWIGDDYSFDNFIQTLVKFRHIVESDTEMKQLFKDLRMFFTKSAQDSSYVNQREKVREDARDLINRTRFFLFDKYRDEFRTLKQEIQYLNRAIQHDETTENLRGNMKQLIDHLLMDSAGNPTLKPELLSDAQILLQVLLKTLKYIPLPPIRKETPNGGSFELDNLVISCTDILPSQIHFGATLDAEKVGSNILEFKLSKVRAHIRNAKFFIDKRDGFPKMKESGFIDVDISGRNGMTIDIELQPERVSLDESKRIDSLFLVRNANCSISKLNLRFRDTKHDGLYKFLGPVINLMARKRIENLVRDQIVEAIKQINTTGAKAATQALRQTDVAKEKASKLPSAAQKTKSKAKSKGKKLEKETRPREQTHGQTHGQIHSHGQTHSHHEKSAQGVIDTTPITSGPGGQSSSSSRGVVDSTPITSGGSSSMKGSRISPRGGDISQAPSSHQGGASVIPPTTGSARGVIDPSPITPVSSGAQKLDPQISSSPSGHGDPLGSSIPPSNH